MNRVVLLVLALALLLLAPLGPSAAAPAVAASPPVLVLDVPDGLASYSATARLTVTIDGAPAAGLAVTFLRSGPGPDVTEVVDGVTDETGLATYAFRLDSSGPYAVEAQVTDTEGVVTTARDEGYAHLRTPCRCSPPRPDLRAIDAANGDDRVLVRHELAAGAWVKLMRKRPDGGAVPIRYGTLDRDGRIAWRVRDRNARKGTWYLVKAGPSEDTVRSSATIAVR
ncbi:hypothetical protein QWY28_05960 [Nocardioides sp. SOB77]|uniref:Ig-like domain repeat protein n=1 Tax=Nocardioides oceani TaxID=3058369 RepID=A0ABT8FD41_9ACTN|nr:hypothetical protein [Nocardioides oceani]MDN4172480.1 hypothetical protein [Nocardioides oceani]